MQMQDVIRRMEGWIQLRDGCRYIAVTDMHSASEVLRDHQFRDVLNSADLVVPDGMAIVWLGRFHGHALRRRVYGPELMTTFCEQAARYGCRHFFYGGKPGIAKKLADIFATRFPGTRVVGTYSPPFRALTRGEDEEVMRRINESHADIVWVGLGAPKQEQWMHNHRERLKVQVLVGVGAAFNIHTGELRQAPQWMREHGLEWLFRLFQEPRRLWRRYLVQSSQFAFNVLLEAAGLRKFE
jgi:N-acetylglucosaminyldiphosphoundecaprenol N-acetyl-beta-D-mannosaminyltransferase